jgi:hypothetical protein
MRGVFGLIGVLVVLGVIVWIMNWTLPGTEQTLKTNEKVREQVTQLSGHDANGTPASASATFDAVTDGGRTTGLLVTKVVADGAYAKYFGLQRNDAIVAFEFQGFRQNIREINDSELAKAQVMETFQKSGSVFVMRNGKEVKLPEAKVAQTPAQPTGQQNPAPTPPPERKSAMDRALAPIQSLQQQGQ